MAEALRQACEIDAEDAADVAAEKCRRAIGAVMGVADEGAEATRVAEGLLYLMGYEGMLTELEPSRAKDEAVRSIQMALAANARQRPLVIVLSEIHWADQLDPRPRRRDVRPPAQPADHPHRDVTSGPRGALGPQDRAGTTSSS